MLISERNQALIAAERERARQEHRLLADVQPDEIAKVQREHLYDDTLDPISPNFSMRSWTSAMECGCGQSLDIASGNTCPRCGHDRSH